MSKETNDFYKAGVRCLNCGMVTRLAIDCGMLVCDYVKENKVTCSNCRCEDAKQAPDNGRTE